MNILLWVLQIVLALLYLAGGAYKTFAFDEVASQLTALPRSAWSVVGVIEMIGGILLIIPAAKWMPRLTALAPTALAVETFALAALYASYSTELTVTNPMPWALVMGLLVAFVASGRSSAD